MKKILYILIPIALLTIIIGKLAYNKQKTVEKVYHYDREQPVQVIAQKVNASLVQPEYSFTGIFEPNRESKLSAEIQGKVNRILVENGNRVKKGQVLIQLDDALLQWQLKAAEVQTQGLESDLSRYRVLVESEAIQGIQLEKTDLALKSAQIQVSTLQEQIKKTSIRSPFEGIITAKLTEEGDFAAPSKPLIQVTDISQLKLTVQVPERELQLFETGKEYPVQIPSLNLYTHGKVSMIGSRGNPANSFPVEITVPNTNNQDIKAGMFGQLSLQREPEHTGILIPSSAIVGSDLKPQVYLIKDGKAMLQNIQIEKRLQDRVWVKSGLNESDMLITGGLINVYEGANVTPNL